MANSPRLTIFQLTISTIVAQSPPQSDYGDSKAYCIFIQCVIMARKIIFSIRFSSPNTEIYWHIGCEWQSAARPNKHHKCNENINYRNGPLIRSHDMLGDKLKL